MIIIKTSPEFSKAQIDLLTQTITEAIGRINVLLPLSDVRFNFFLDDNQTIPEWGVGGYCENSNQIDIALSPGRERDWKLHVPRTAAHEWHHLARWRGPGYGKTLSTVMISEGLAQHFEVDCFPGAPSFFSSFLAEKERAKIRETFIREFYGSQFDHSRWFFGKGEFPFQAGYDLSFSILGEYLERTQSTAAHEVSVTPERLCKVAFSE